MKILFFGVTENESTYIKNWSEAHQISVHILTERLTMETVHETNGFDGVCFYPAKEMLVNEEIYRQLQQNGVRVLSIKSTGVDGVNFEFAGKYELTVTNVPSYSPTSVGHFTVMLIVMLLRNFSLYLSSGSHAVPRKNLIGREFSDITVGVLGTGRIGTVVAESMIDMGAKVLVSSYSKQNPRLAGKARYVSFDELVEQSDVITIHIPATQKTEHLFSEEVFQRMKAQSVLVNCSRGQIIDTKALIRWMQTGKCGGLGLDTLENEEDYFAAGWKNNPYYQELIKYPNVVITPHIAFYTELAVKQIVETALDNVRDIVLIGESLNIVA